MLSKQILRNKTAHTFGLCLRLMPSRAKNKTLSAWMVSPCLTFILFLVEPMAATISSTSAPMMPTQIQPTASPATTLSIFHASSLALPCTHASNFAQIKLYKSAILMSWDDALVASGKSRWEFETH